MKTEKEIRKDIIEVLKLLWERRYVNTTGVSISERINNDYLVVDQSGTGFRRCKITEDELLVIDTDCELVKDAPSGSIRKAPVNTVIHTEYYKVNDLARACIHCHAPYSQIFACENKSIFPYTLQSQIIGEVPCISVDDKKFKEEFSANKVKLKIPSGLHSRPDVLYVMREVARLVAENLLPRNQEMEHHGLGITHYQHGIFVFGRNIWEAFDSLERIEANARAILFSKLLAEK